MESTKNKKAREQLQRINMNILYKFANRLISSSYYIYLIQFFIVVNTVI